jgi:hypothetical protein
MHEIALPNLKTRLYFDIDVDITNEIDKKSKLSEIYNNIKKIISNIAHIIFYMRH